MGTARALYAFILENFCVRVDLEVFFFKFPVIKELLEYAYIIYSIQREPLAFFKKKYIKSHESFTSVSFILRFLTLIGCKITFSTLRHETTSNHIKIIIDLLLSNVYF